MAAVPPIEVSAIWDGTRLKAGTEEAERAVESLADNIDTSSDEIKRSLDSIEATADSAGTSLKSVDDISLSGVGQEVEQADSKMKALGQTASEEIPGAMTDLSDSAADAATGLSTAFATLGPAGIAVGAVLAGIGIMMRKSQEAKEKFTADAQAWTDAYIEGLGKITAATRRAKLEEDLLNPDSVIAQAEKVRQAIGADQSLVVSSIYGTPAERAAAQADLETKISRLTARYDTVIDKREKQLLTDGYVSEELDEQFNTLTRQVNGYEDLLGLVRNGVDAQKAGRDAAREQLETYEDLGLLTREEEKTLERIRDRQRENAQFAKLAADANTRSADAMERMERAAYGIGQGLGSAARNAANIALDLGT